MIIPIIHGQSPYVSIFPHAKDSPQSETAAPLLSLPPNQGQTGDKKTRKDTGKAATAETATRVTYALEWTHVRVL